MSSQLKHSRIRTPGLPCIRLFFLIVFSRLHFSVV